MENKFEDKIIENEINSLLGLVLHLDSYLIKGKEGFEGLKQKIIKLNLSRNSRDIIYQIISSQKLSYYFSFDENIKKLRNNNGIMKAINDIFKKNDENEEKAEVIRNINAYNFNQISLVTTQSFFSSEAEFYFLKNFIHSKLLKIIKSCFDDIFTKKQEKTSNVNKKNNFANYTTNFILISHSSLRTAKFINEILSKNGNLSLSNKFIKLTNFKPLNPKDIKTFKKSLSSNELNIQDNSKIYSLYKSQKNSSKANSSDFNMNNKNSSSCGESSNKIYDFNSMNISNGTNKKINFFTKKNINLIKRVESNDHEKTFFLPILKLKEINYERRPKFKWRKIPSVNSDNKELINYNTKNNIRLKNEQTFLDECMKESVRNLFEINDTYKTKCFVDYYKSSISNDNIFKKKNEEKKVKEKIIFPGFEYKNIIKYHYNRKLNRAKNKIKFLEH